jgi:magnesium transporter
VRAREERRLDRLARYEEKRRRRLADDPAASDPSSVSNSTFSLSDEDAGWLSTQAEMVIEPYFMSLMNTGTRLAAINEFIDDTEDFINITLDSHRNQLIQVDLLLTAATFCVGLVTLIAGNIGMTGWNNSLPAFVLVTVLSAMLAVGLLVGFVQVMRKKRLAFV